MVSQISAKMLVQYLLIGSSGILVTFVQAENFLLVYGTAIFIKRFLQKELLLGGFPDQIGNWESSVLHCQALCMGFGEPREVHCTSVGCASYLHSHFRA